MNHTLHDIRVWDGEAVSYLEGHRDLTIEDGEIKAVAPSSPGSPDGSTRATSSFTVLPGLIDAHVHLSADPDKWSAKQVTEDEFDELRLGMDQRAASMVRAGITTARDLGGGAWLELELRDRIAAGESEGPRLLCAGQPVTSPGGHCHFWGGEAEGPDAVREVVTRQIGRGVDLIKVMATGGQMTRASDPAAVQFDEATIAAIVRQARESGRYVAAHCHGTGGIRNACYAGVRTIEHCSWRGPEGSATDYDPEVAARIGANGVWVSPTVNTGWQRFLDGSPEFVAQVQANFRAMREAGVQLIASTDAGIPGVHPHRLADALPIFAHFAGLTPVETLRAATSAGAEAIGLGAVTGRVKEGFAADLLVVEGDPLADLAVLAKPVAVVARGRVVVDQAGLFEATTR